MDSEPEAEELKNDLVDRISSLPNSLLGKILSNLPTKDAVATSILSTRWKALFPFEVQPLLLHLSDSGSSSTSFRNFLDKLLCESLVDVPCLEMMHLECNENSYGDAKIIYWVTAALRSNAHHLKLEFSLKNSKALFQSLNGCTKLTRLDLGKLTEFSVPDDFVLPNITWLCLYDLLLGNGQWKSINKLIDGCPAIKDFRMRGCNMKNVQLFRIQSTSLESLCIYGSFYDSACQLVLDTPNLEVLYYDLHNPESRFVVSDLKSLQRAVFDCALSPEVLSHIDYDHGWPGDCVGKLVAACSRTTRLYVYFYHGGLGVVTKRGWGFLARMLHKAPNLQKLTIEEVAEDKGGWYERFEYLVRSVPICLELHVKEIEFLSFEGFERELKLIEYFLKNAKVMQQLKVHCLPFEDTTNSNSRRLEMLQSQSRSKISLEPSLGWERMEMKSKFLPTMSWLLD